MTTNTLFYSCHILLCHTSSNLVTSSHICSILPHLSLAITPVTSRHTCHMSHLVAAVTHLSHTCHTPITHLSHTCHTPVTHLTHFHICHITLELSHVISSVSCDTQSLLIHYPTLHTLVTSCPTCHSVLILVICI